MPGIFDYNKAEIKLSVIKVKNRAQRIEISRTIMY